MSSPGFGKFFIIYADKSKVEFPIPTPELIIGSSASSGLRLEGPGVPAEQARFEWRDGHPVISDMAAGQNMLVNQVPVRQHVLCQGDVIRLGDVFMVYHRPRASASAEAGDKSVSVPTTGSAFLRNPTLLPEVISGRLNQHHLADIVQVGRDPSNTIVLDSLQVSRFHAEIVPQAGSFVLRDQGSTNGTFVNGQRVQSANLQCGDMIRISDYNFYFDGTKLEHFSEEGNARIDAISLRRVVNGKQVILHDISISIYPREFVAVVGVSGAGKSTFINALSGFRPADSGVVLLNGIDYYSHLESFRSTLGYVPQDDIIHPELLCGRALHYAALLRMPDDIRYDEVVHRIDDVLSVLQLTERKDIPIHRLSGGQRKRVSIGVELLTRPRLFYLDEPTSGLDPGMEAEMMRTFRDLSDRGHTLIVITHATRNIMLCDKVIFLARGGYLAFFGSPHEALEYFKTDDFADIYLQVDHQKTPEQWDQDYKKSSYYQQHIVQRLKAVNQLVEQAKTSPTASLPLAARTGEHARGSQVRQFKLLAQRYLEILTRDRINMTILLAQAPILAIVLLIYCQPDIFKHFDVDAFISGALKPDKLATKGKVILFLLTFFSLMCGTINSVREIIKEYPIYKRERTVNLHIFPYIMSKMMVLSMVSVLQTVIFVGIVFSQVHPPAGAEHFYLNAFVTLFAVNLASTALGLTVSAGVNNQNTAITMIPIVLLCQVVLSGALLPLEGLKFLSSLTIMKWGFEMLGKITEIWQVLPAEADFKVVPPAARPFIEMGATYKDTFDVSFLENLIVLLAFAALFVLLACGLQRAKDLVKD